MQSLERVVKGLMGYSAEKEGKPATHMILTIEEYEDLTRELARTQLKVKQTKEYCDDQMKNYKRECDKLLQEEQKKAQEDVRASQELLNNAKGEIGRLNDLNANLLRISRERANAKRGLKPKKTHHGYMVLDSQQHKYSRKFYNSRALSGQKMIIQNFPCWKIRIQSPYDSSIPFNVITKNIEDDLNNNLGKNIGINRVYLNSELDDMSLNDIKELWADSNINFIFKTSYKSNYKSGLWEVEYWVKNSISVPENMRVI